MEGQRDGTCLNELIIGISPYLRFILFPVKETRKTPWTGYDGNEFYFHLWNISEDDDSVGFYFQTSMADKFRAKGRIWSLTPSCILKPLRRFPKRNFESQSLS